MEDVNGPGRFDSAFFVRESLKELVLAKMI
jgi:hypothetical protein